MNIRQLAVVAIAAAASGGFCAGQTCTVTSPTNGQVVSGIQAFQFMVSVSSAPSAYKVVWSVDQQRWATGYARDTHRSTTPDYRDVWQGPFTVSWFPGLMGDGTKTISAIVQDIYGTKLATCSQTLVVRGMGTSNNSLTAVPTTGRGQLTMATFDGNQVNRGGIYIDGYPLPYDTYCGGAQATSATGGWGTPTFNSSCFPNGLHQMMMSYSPTFITDPYMLAKTFTSTGVNTSTGQITLSNHYSSQGSLVTFSSSGTLPAPLVTGCQYGSGTSASGAGNSNTASYSISGQTLTVTTNNGCNFAPGVPVFIRNVHETLKDGSAPCDGYYAMATGSGTSFTVSVPSTCTAAGLSARATGNWQFEVVVNPYFTIYLDQNTIQVSASCISCSGTVTPGPAVIPTDGGSGTHTIVQRIRSPYWGMYGDFFNQAATGGTSPPVYATKTVTFANGNAPMLLHPKYWEMNLVAGASPTALCDSTQLVQNSDLSFTATACNGSGVSWTEIDDGGLSNVCSVDSSGNVTPLMAGWCQIKAQCTACAAGGLSLPPVTTYVHVWPGSVTASHFTHNGSIATAFSPGNSFFPFSAWKLTTLTATSYVASSSFTPSYFLGPMMHQSNLNSAMIAPDPSDISFGDPATTSCYAASWPTATHNYETAFGATFGVYFEADIESTHWGLIGSPNLSALLNNVGYDRKGCFTGFLRQLVAEGRTWRLFGYDELNQYMAGLEPFRNPMLGSSDFPSIVVSNGVATYNVSETFQGTWSQSAGTGDWIKMSGAMTNTCLNGWFPVTALTPDPNRGPWSGAATKFTTPTTCANGTYTESTAQLFHYYVLDAQPTIMENADVLPRLYGTGNNILKQNWDATYFSGISVSSAVATFTMHNHGIVNDRAIRVRGSASGHNLNVVAPVTVIDNDHFTITYKSLWGALPADGTYNSSTDPGLYVTVDPNFPSGSPFLSLRNLIASVPGAPAVTWPAIGFTFNPGNPGVRQWTGSTLGADAANNYVPQGPFPIYGHDGSVAQWLIVSDSSSGIITRPWQLDARAMLWSAGLNYNHYCVSINFDPGCDHPNQLNWRPETTVAQLLGMVADGVRALRLYNFAGAPPVDYMNCCGWNSPGTINDIEMSSYVSPKAWSAMAHTSLLVKLREDTLLEPPGNKPYLGPFFKTDVHMSPTYGNQTMVICGSEMPYGAFPVPLNPIPGGSTLLYTNDGYSTRVSTVAGNPSSVTKEWCPSPAFTNTFVSLPPSPIVQPIDNITFAPPAPLSFGASKFLIQVGYYPADMDSDPVIDCTAACTIPIDHHNTEAYYRVIYADANSLPLSIGDPTKIPSQGLY